MKKKLLITFLCVFMVIPCVINAKTYYNAVSIVGNYMKNNTFVSSYEKYIHTQIVDSHFYDEDNDYFQMGGLLSKKEFDITDIKYDDMGKELTGISYLYSTTPFWTLTSKESNPESKYVVSSIEGSWYGKNEQEDVKSIEIKATEYVKPETRVSGSGTYSDPWYFNPKYKVFIQVNDNGKYGKINVGGESVKDYVFEFDDFSQKVSFTLEPNSPNNYLGNTCPELISRDDKNKNNLVISNVTSDATCIINFGRSQYNITLNPGACLGTVIGALHEIKNIEYNTPNKLNNVFSCQGFSFKGWNTEEDGSGISFNDNEYYDGKKIEELGVPLENNSVLNLYAQWEDISSVVKLNQNGATTLSEPSWKEGFSITYGDKIEDLISIPKKEYSISFAGTNIPSKNYDYTFAGFYLDSEENIYIDSNGNGRDKPWDKKGGNFELKAKWDGKGIKLPNVEQKGYIFKGWYDSANFSNYVGNANDFYKPNQSSISLNSGRIGVTLYPNMEKIKYYIEFDPNGGTGHMDKMTMEFGEEKNLLPNQFEKPGYNFYGWVGPDGQLYDDEHSVANLSTVNGDTVKLYARWGGEGFKEDFEDDIPNPKFTFSNFSKTAHGNTTLAEMYGLETGIYSPSSYNPASFFNIFEILKSEYMSPSASLVVEFDAEYSGKLNFTYGNYLFDHSQMDAGWGIIGILDNNKTNRILNVSQCIGAAEAMCSTMFGGNGTAPDNKYGSKSIDIQAGHHKVEFIFLNWYGKGPFLDNIEVIYN